MMITNSDWEFPPELLRVQTEPARHDVCTLKGTSRLASVLHGSGLLPVFSHHSS